MAGLFPIWAGALGLGEAETRSALNQPLAVEIPVLSATPAEIAGLEVSLAGPETFERYGLPQPVGLGELNFAVTPAPPAGGLIRITSNRAVVEPFVTLLLEVRWPQGRLLREYTVLLDPPAFSTGAVQPAVQAPAAPLPAAQPITRAAPAAIASEATNGQTHTVASRETLWGIASRYRPDPSIDMNQMMLAIYRANPDAFAGNINRLRAGAILRIPNVAEVRSAGRQEALAEIRRQNEAWQAAVPGPDTGRLQLVPPREQQASPAPAAASAEPTGEARSALEETRRQLALRDAEIAALREQLAKLQQQRGEAAVAATEPAAAPTPPAPGGVPAAEKSPVGPAGATAVPAEKSTARPPRSRPTETSWLDAISGLFESVWTWVVLMLALGTALFVARRRASGTSPRQRSPQLAGAAAGSGLGQIPIGEEKGMVVEESARPLSTSAPERKPPAPRVVAEEQGPLERTISTEGPVNLDQADPLAEADFHMAYGLYDQAAELLTKAVNAEPNRRDLRLKLLDVYFVWENREGFLAAARALRERIASDADPDWKRVVLMGKQLCPDDPLFAGVATAGSDLDLALSADAGIDVDVPFVEESGDLDFDLTEAQSPQVTGFEESASTKVAKPSWVAQGAQTAATVETPTVKTVTPGATLEAPTIEARTDKPGTMEIPTIESPLVGRTVETPTLESWAPDVGGTARVPSIEEPPQTTAGEPTEEIDLDELGLDLTGLDEAVKDISTGLQEALPAADEMLDLELGGELESTAEMAGVDATGAGERIAAAVQRSTAAMPAEDTVEQPSVARAESSQVVEALPEDQLSGLNVDLGLGTDSQESQATATGLRPLGPRTAEDPTMTEVGTKLDLARAYLDMGDPDGARSILNEVLEEGDAAQRQEARQLLDTLGD